MTISTNNVIEINEFRTAVGAGWTFLSDSRRRLQKALDIAEYTDADHQRVIAHTLMFEELRLNIDSDLERHLGRRVVESAPDLAR